MSIYHIMNYHKTSIEDKENTISNYDNNKINSIELYNKVKESNKLSKFIVKVNDNLSFLGYKGIDNCIYYYFYFTFETRGTGSSTISEVVMGLISIIDNNFRSTYTIDYNYVSNDLSVCKTNTYILKVILKPKGDDR